MDDAKKNDEDKAEEGKDTDQEPIQDEQAKDEVAGVLVSMTHKEKPKLLISTSSQSVSSNYGNQFLISSPERSLLGTVKESTDAEITSMVDVQIQQEISFVLSAPLLDVLASVVPPTPTNPTPPPIPTTSTKTTYEAPTSTSVNLESKTLSALQLRVSNLEKEVKELKQVDLSTKLRASIGSEVPSAVNEYLGSSLGDALQKEFQKHTEELRHKYSQKSTSEIQNIKMEHVEKQQKSHYTIKSSDKTTLAEFDQKQALFDSMHESKSFSKHPANKTLYHALIESLIADENAIDQGVADLIKHKKRPHKNDDRDQDPPARPDQVLKKRKTDKDAGPLKNPKSTGSSKDTKRSQQKLTGKSVQAEEIVFEATDTDMPFNQGDDMGNTDEQPDVEVAPKADWFKNLKELLLLILNGIKANHTLIDFSAFAMNRLKISKLIKVDLVGTVYNLLKGTCKSYVELEYNIEECYRALSDQLDWNNPKGNRCPYDLSKPLPLHEYQGRLTVLADFFNNDLEYLKGGSTDRKYTTSITKTKYNVEGIEDMVPKLWSPIKVSKHDVYSTMRILSVTSVTVDEWYRYGHLKEIVLRRADQKLYKFMEGDFSRQHLNDIEDMLLLVAQNKLNSLDGNVIVHLVVGLRMYTRRIVIQSRVEDL
ncbi:hypothetical protein Tco_1427617 [Tanacetum coccineum]